jgi:hypothetical protein
MTFGAVTISRNDGYGGILSEYRALLCLQNCIDRYNEVVYVDYNSPNDMSLMECIKGALKFKGNLKHIKVTTDDIRALNESLLSVPFIMVLARNIGIRRATSDFILSCNIDGISARPPEGLDTNTLYTAPKKNIALSSYLYKEDDPTKFGDELISGKIPYVDMSADTVDALGNPISYDPEDNYSLVFACGDFQLAHKNVWYKIRGFEESLLYRDYDDYNLMRKGQIYCNIKKIDHPVYHLNHDRDPNAIRNKNYGRSFQKTANGDDWGFATYPFKVEIL